MCIILDADCYSRFRNLDNEDMEPVRKWLDNRNGKIIYSNTRKFKKEWEKGGMDRWVIERKRAGQLKLAPPGVEEKETELKGKVRSNDAHIIALALIAKVKVLVSHDIELGKDFKNYVVQGKVYKTKKHKRLLKNDLCP